LRSCWKRKSIWKMPIHQTSRVSLKWNSLLLDDQNAMHSASRFLLLLGVPASVCVTAEALRANIGLKSAISFQLGPIDPKFQVEGSPSSNHSSPKTRLNDLSYGIKIWTDLSSILSQYTCLTDGQNSHR